MEITKLKAEKREDGGTRASRRLRRTGKLPGIVYGHKQEPEKIAVDVHDVTTLLEHGAHVIDLDLGGKGQRVLIKKVQYDYLGEELVHVDFARVDLTEKVHLSVPLEFKGTPVGTHEGGVLDHSLVDLEIECTVTEIPDSIRVNVGDMKVGDLIHVSNLTLPPGIKAVTPADAVVCSVRAKTAAATIEEEELAEEEGEQQPEIIGREKKEDEEGSEES